MIDKLLRSQYNFISRLSTYVIRQQNKAIENGAVQRKGAWGRHLFCIAALEEQKPEGNSSFDLTTNRSQNQSSLNENYVWNLETQNSVSGEWHTRDKRKCSDLGEQLPSLTWTKGAPLWLPLSLGSFTDHLHRYRGLKKGQRWHLVGQFCYLLINKSRTSIFLTTKFQFLRTYMYNGINTKPFFPTVSYAGRPHAKLSGYLKLLKKYCTWLTDLAKINGWNEAWRFCMDFHLSRRHLSTTEIQELAQPHAAIHAHYPAYWYGLQALPLPPGTPPSTRANPKRPKENLEQHKEPHSQALQT